jgi:predicted nucleic acid-binding protein
VPCLVDTSGLFALADSSDDAHQAVRQYISGVNEELVVLEPIVTEVDYLVANRLGVHVELAMLKAIADGVFRLESLTAGDFDRSLELIAQYADSNIGFVDASIVATAERLRITRILTLDHRHFRMFRPKHCEAFDLVP